MDIKYFLCLDPKPHTGETENTFTNLPVVAN